MLLNICDQKIRLLLRLCHIGLWSWSLGPCVLRRAGLVCRVHNPLAVRRLRFVSGLPRLVLSRAYDGEIGGTRVVIEAIKLAIGTMREISLIVTLTYG